MTTPRFVTFRGETLSVYRMALQYKKCPATVRRRLLDGRSIEYALFGKRDGQASVTIDGVTRTIDGWCKRIGITRKAFYKRRKRGNVLTAPAQKRKGVTAWGRTQYLREWEVECHIKTATIWHRINKLGMTPEQALTMPVDERYRRNEK